jgi:hypothetical protein
LHSGATHFLGYFGDSHSPSAEFVDELGVNAYFSPLIDAKPFRAFDTFALTFLNEPPFHLGDHPENSQNYFAHFPLGGNIWFKDSNVGTALFAIVNNI